MKSPNRGHEPTPIAVPPVRTAVGMQGNPAYERGNQYTDRVARRSAPDGASSIQDIMGRGSPTAPYTPGGRHFTNENIIIPVRGAGGVLENVDSGMGASNGDTDLPCEDGEHCEK